MDFNKSTNILKFNVEECFNNDCVSFLEHVTLDLKIDIKVGSIKDIDIVLTSPSNTASFLLTKKPSERGRKDETNVISWPFMSVHFWGELSNGTWTATVQNNLPTDVSGRCLKFV